MCVHVPRARVARWGRLEVRGFSFLSSSTPLSPFPLLEVDSDLRIVRCEALSTHCACVSIAVLSASPPHLLRFSPPWSRLEGGGMGGGEAPPMDSHLSLSLRPSPFSSASALLPPLGTSPDPCKSCSPRLCCRLLVGLYH